MSYILNKKIRDLKPYDPIQGNYRIRLDANESFFPMPEQIRAKTIQFIEQAKFNRYPDPLASAVCEAFASYYEVDPQLVTAWNGSDESISVIMTAFLMRGDKVITLSNDFSMYRFYADLAEGESIEFEKNEDLTISVPALIQTIQDTGAKMVIFSNPCNPTSLGLQRKDVLELIRSVDALIVLDEAYMDFWDQSLLDCVADFYNLIILRTCSKAFGMAGIRLGFSVANPTLTNAMQAVKSPYNSNIITQEIGAAVYAEKECMQQHTKEIIRSRETLFHAFLTLQKQYPTAFTLYESCTNFVYLKTQQSKEIYMFLLENSIAVRYFSRGFLRITAGTESENQAVIDAFYQFLQHHSESR